ncbi:MAG: DUF1987 domain-containing protein [Bacteroidales bacterium]|jgi:hypothetical protein
MEPIFINGTNRTPFVSMDPSGSFRIRGRSIHENPTAFFEPILRWVDAYLKNPGNTIVFDIELEYFNSGSSRFILEILRILMEKKGNIKLVVNWYYEDGDDDLLERGQYYESILNTKFNFIEFQ